MNKARQIGLGLIAVFILLVAGLNTRAQTSGSISGVVKDQQNASVSGAKVSLIPSQQPAVQTTETDFSGLFSFQNVAPGSYEIRIEHTGFTSHRLPVNVSSAQLSEVSALLEVAGIRDFVTVSAETGQAQDKHLVAQQVNVVNEQAIVQRATGVLAQVADEEVGVSMQRTSPTIGAVLVRGLTEVGVYVDGVRYTNATQRGGINTFFNLNEPTSLRSVELLRGPNTAQYGSDSLGGTVQLVSRQPDYGFAS
ncbi:MAG TPA: carboxypeptidase regulatory-like domain-containing protein, partial [Pyrinomonadaceae bacterium]|nr:carboxypeptidase regulatory-like domain-containing protein [Pyrinomonadaceae bacterium]